MNYPTDKSQSPQQNLIQLLETGENEQIEFKKSFDKEAVESLSSFANTKGGSVLIGVEDSGVVKGVSVGKETLQNWNNQIKQSCTPSILPDTDIISYEDKKIVVLTIPEYPVKPICCKGKYFKRVNNSNHQMALHEIAELHLKTFNTSWDHYPDSNHKLDTISLKKVNNFILRTSKTRPFPLDDSPLTVLKKYELIKENDQITNACYLLFADSDIMLTAIDVGRFTSETIIKDSVSINTDLFSSVDAVLDLLRKHINKGYIISGDAQREERWEYPMDALREIVINMIVHRDYTSPSESMIKIFDDHIEFFNPGQLSGGLSIQQLLSGNYTSSIRNKQIATLFKEAGLIERYGSGIKRILESFAKYDLELPLFEELQRGFRVIVSKTTQKTTQKVTQKTTQKVTTKKQVLELLRLHPDMTRSDLALQLSKSENTIKGHLATLKAEGKLKRIGSDRSGYWEVVSDGK